ncbi:MAG: hypothetical protein Q9214_002031 [Letrouitia sp. 1 TL-2023]
MTFHRFYADKTVKVPEMAESISEGTLKQWSKQIGDHVEQDEEIATIETDKIDVAVNSPEAGKIKEYLVKEEDTVTVGQDIATLELGGAPQETEAEHAKQQPKEPAPSNQPSPSESRSSPDSSESKSPPPSSQPQESSQPSQQQAEAPKQATKPKETELHPSPKDSRKEESRQSQSTGTVAANSTGSGETVPYGSRGERRVKMNRMRLRIAERLKQSQNTAASLTTFNEVDMSSLMQFRKLYKDDVLKKHNVKIGFMGAFSRACVLAMRDVPAVNASIEGPGGGDTIVYRDYVDISVAVATEKGLVTPVVRNAESLDIIHTEKAIADLGKKARDNKLTIEDMAGGSFTISNGGVFGSLMGTPIINLPQTAVLGLHAVKEKPVAIDGKVEIRPVSVIDLRYDPNLPVIFLVKVKEYIEDPRKMLLY